MKNPKYHTVETILKHNRKIAERGKFDTYNTQIHVLDHKWLLTNCYWKQVVIFYAKYT